MRRPGAIDGDSPAVSTSAPSSPVAAATASTSAGHGDVAAKGLDVAPELDGQLVDGGAVAVDDEESSSRGQQRGRRRGPCPMRPRSPRSSCSSGPRSPDRPRWAPGPDVPGAYDNAALRTGNGMLDRGPHRSFTTEEPTMARPAPPSGRSTCAAPGCSTSTRASWSSRAALLIEGDRIAEVSPTSVPDDAVVIDLGDLTLLPGLMDMEVNLLLGGPDHASPLDRGAGRPRRAHAAGGRQRPADPAGRLHDRAQPRPVHPDRRHPARRRPQEGHRPRLDRRAPRRPRRPRHLPTGGHLDPTMFQAFAPHVLPLTVEEGIANGVDEVRKAVRYQIKYGAAADQGVRLGRRDVAHRPRRRPAVLRTRSCAAIADEAHRAGLKVAAHAHGDDGIRAAIEAGIDCIEHGSLMTDETLDLFIERGTFLVRHHLPRRRHGRLPRRRPSCRPRRPRCSPGPRPRSARPSPAARRIACGTDAPAIPHGRNAKELIAVRACIRLDVQSAREVAGHLQEPRAMARAGRLAEYSALVNGLAPGPQRVLAPGSGLHRSRHEQGTVGRAHLSAARREHAAVGCGSLPPHTDCINVIVADKQKHLQFMTMDEAIVHCAKGVGIWARASTDAGEEPDVVLASCGDVATMEALAAAAILRERIPDLKLRFVNVVDLFKLQPDTSIRMVYRSVSSTACSRPTSPSSSTFTDTRG